MTRFVQWHFLTVYGPANLNRDDTGRPKSAIFGGAPRLRISSQSLKRAWRESAVFAETLAGRLGIRTQRLGEELAEYMTGKGMTADKAQTHARSIVAHFGKLEEAVGGESANAEAEKKPKKAKKDSALRTKQLAFIGPEEKAIAYSLADRALAGEAIAPEKTDILRRTDTAADIAMFGRMLADAPDFNREAAVQVAHAITTHRAIAEDDYYTAVDDLKRPGEDAGAGFLGVQEFGAGVFYLYLCVDRDLLDRNLAGDKAIANAAVQALGRAAATIAPGGKQASFASRAYAHHILVECGTATPRSLVAAFLKPVTGEDYLAESVDRLTKLCQGFDAAYGKGDIERKSLTVGAAGTGLEDILAFASGAK